MTWTYDTTLSTDLAKVRTLIGDVLTTDQALTDEQINFVLGERSDIYLAAADCCDLLVAKYARDIDRSNVGMSSQRSQKVQHYTDLGGILRAKVGTYGEVTLTGSSLAEHDDLDSDTDYVEAAFVRNRDSNGRA